MKNLSWSLFAILLSLFTSCDKLDDDVDFDDLIGTWNVESYLIEGRPSSIPPLMRVSFYQNYEYVSVANNENGDGSMGTFSFNDHTNDLAFAGNICYVETLNWSTLKVRFTNGFHQRCEMTYKRVPQQSLNPDQRLLTGRWEQHINTPVGPWGDAMREDYYLYFYPNGDFADISKKRSANGNFIESFKFGHYELEGDRITLFFGTNVEYLPVYALNEQFLTLQFATERATYTRSF